MRYCTIFLVRKTRFAYTFLHEKKDEFPAILDNLMARFDPAQRPKILICDGAGEYDSQEFRTVLAKYPGVTVRRSNAHEQSANGMAEKMVDRIGRMLRTTLLQSPLPPEFWGAAVVLATDVYNCKPNSALNNQSPRVRGRNDNTAQLETLSLYHDMPNATIADITERIKSNSVQTNQRGATTTP
jgi:hypothetical protein